MLFVAIIFSAVGYSLLPVVSTAVAAQGDQKAGNALRVVGALIPFLLVISNLIFYVLIVRRTQQRRGTGLTVRFKGWLIYQPQPVPGLLIVGLNLCMFVPAFYSFVRSCFSLVSLKRDTDLLNRSWSPL